MIVANRCKMHKQDVDFTGKWQALGDRHRGPNQGVIWQTSPKRPPESLAIPAGVANSPAPLTEGGGA